MLQVNGFKGLNAKGIGVGHDHKGLSCQMLHYLLHISEQWLQGSFGPEPPSPMAA